MNKKRVIFLAAALMIGLTAAVLLQVRGHQRLGPPAVRVAPSDEVQTRVLLPEKVLDYESKELQPTKLVLDYLPKDTSYGQRLYRAPDGFWVQVNVVLMGRDRTSLHKPEFCLSGQGWRIDNDASAETEVSLARPQPYELPVMKLIASQQTELQGKPVTLRGVYVYWFVAPEQCTARHTQRMWWMARDLLTRGVLQRWAYVTYFAVCSPGEENATFERMKGLIAASVPEFQTTPGSGPIGSTAQR